MKTSILGQYRQIIISIALFVVLDVAVLSLNFYISKALREDTTFVSDAGMLQTLSQQLLGNVYQLEQAMREGSNAPAALLQMQQNYQQLDDNLQRVLISAKTGPRQHSAARQVQAVWQGVKSRLFPVINVPEPIASAWFEQDLQQAKLYLSSNNDALLEAFSALSQTIKNEADVRMEWLRWVQLGAILLALINFAFIVFYFIARLKANDKSLQQAKQNTEQILDFVNEGLLLLEPSLKISKQYSKFCLQIFAMDDIAGKNFTDLLQDKISEKELQSVHKYLRLLFDGSAKETLLEELNPLRQIRLLASNEQGEFSHRYISFSFRRTFLQNAVDHVLVTVTDKSRLVELSDRLEAAKQSQTGQLDVLNAILAIDKQEFFLFVNDSAERLHKVNAILQQPSKKQEQFEKQVHKIVIELHKLKGEASMLALHDVAQNAHKMERTALDLLHQERITGKAFLPLTVRLKAILKQFDQYQKIATQLNQPVADKLTENDELSIVSEKSLNNLVQSIAQKQNKKIQLQLQQKGKERVPSAMLRSVRDIVVQLVRNAASHGVERSVDRALKSSAGKINVRIIADSNELSIVVRDDGRGIDLEAVKEKALVSGKILPSALNKMTEQEGFALLFEPGLSTATYSSLDSGRGMGMLAVKKMLQSLNGRISIAQATGEYCQFTVRLPLKETSLIDVH